MGYCVIGYYVTLGILALGIMALGIMTCNRYFGVERFHYYIGNLISNYP